MLIRSFLIALLLVQMTDTATGEEKLTNPIQPLWQMPNSERIALRCDIGKAAERRAEYRRAHTDQSGGDTGVVVDVIDGKIHPELFLPTEVFAELIRQGFIDPDWRSAYDADIAAAGLPADFWNELESLASRYIEEARAQRQVLDQARNSDAGAQTRAASAARSMDRHLCVERTAALKKARDRFGIALDRFMYESIGSGMAIAFSTQDDPATLNDHERGCQ